MSREKSSQAFARAKQLIPGGVNSPARAFGGVGGEPLFFERGEGAYLFDVDGNRYIDYIGSWGPMILGHCHPQVTAALEQAVRRGTSFGAPTEAESELAQLIVEAVPSIEKVRLVNSGTEATMSAIRLARGFTGRDVIVKFAGNYHGHVDSLLVAAGSAAATLAVPNSPGVTAGTAQDTLVLQYNDVDGLAAAFAAHGARIAGVIFEPVVGNMGCVLPTPEFLRALREETAAPRRAVDLRRSDDRLPRGLRRRPAALGHLARPDDAGQDHRRRAAGGRLRRQGGNHGPRAAGRQGVSGRHASGNPLATAAGIATLKVLRERIPTIGWNNSAPGSKPGWPPPHAKQAFRTRRRARQHVDPLLQRRSGARLACGEPLRHETLCPLFLGLDRARRLHALQPVRSLVRFYRPHRERYRSDNCRGEGGVGGLKRHASGLSRRDRVAEKRESSVGSASRPGIVTDSATGSGA